MVNTEEENFSEERLRKIDVHKLLPQQEPFCYDRLARTFQ